MKIMRKYKTVCAAVVLGFSAFSSAAGAAGTSYTGGRTPAPGRIGASLPIVAVKPIGASGSNSTVKIPCGSLSITTPVHNFGANEQLVVGNAMSLAKARTRGSRVVFAYSISVVTKSAHVVASFGKYLHVEINSCNIKSGDLVYKYVGGTWGSRIGASVRNGHIYFPTRESLMFEAVTP